MNIFKHITFTLPCAYQTGTPFAERISLFGFYFQWDSHGGREWGFDWKGVTP